MKFSGHGQKLRWVQEWGQKVKGRGHEGWKCENRSQHIYLFIDCYLCGREKTEDGSITALGSRLSTNVKSQQTAPGYELLSLHEKKVSLL